MKRAMWENLTHRSDSDGEFHVALKTNYKHMKTQCDETLFHVENYNYLLIPKRIVMNRIIADKVLINIKFLIR